MLGPMADKAGASTKGGRAWQRNATRKAILAVGRRMVERDGMELTSLTRVAEEAGYAPVTVYAYFPNKNDLLTSIFADDLAVLAREMRDSFPYSEPQPEPEPAAEEPAQEIAQTPAEPEAADDVAPEPQAESADVVSLMPAAMPLAQKPSCAHLESEPPSSRSERIRAALRKSRPNEGTPPEYDKDAPRVDAWLERRLRVFERTLSEIEARLAETERGSQRAASLSQDNAASLDQHIETLQKRDSEDESALSMRLAELEKRQRETTAELRASLKDTQGRLDRLETVALGPAKPAVYLPPDKPPTPEEPSDESPPPEQSTDTEKQKQRTSSEAKETFLTAARRAAMAAATLARIEDDERSITMTQRTKLMLVAGLALLAMVAGAVFVLHALPARPATMQFLAVSRAMVKQIGTGTARIHLSSAAVYGRVAALAEAGNVKAEVLTGLNYLNGEGVAKNDVQAALWLGRAANAGDAVAQYWLGTLYQAGRGVNDDSASATHWLESAAMQGNRKAMHSLAMAYASGAGVTKDFGEAARWFSRAANLGLVNSQFNLAVLYERGEGLPQSLLDAYKWYAIAAAQGDSEAQARVDALATQLSPDDLAAAKQSAANFRPEPLNASTNLILRSADLSNG